MTYYSSMSTTHEHILPMPMWVVGIRGAQCLLGLIILGLSAYGVQYASFDGDALNVFTALITMLLTAYILVAYFYVPGIYNYWAILGIDVFGAIFWLVSFALLSSEVGDNFRNVTVNSGSGDFSSGGGGGGSGTYCYDGYCVKGRSLVKRSTSYHTWKGALTAVCVFGAFEFLMFVATLVLHLMSLMSHRKAGGRALGGGGGGVESTAVPVEMHQQHETAYNPPHSNPAPPSEPYPGA